MEYSKNRILEEFKPNGKKYYTKSSILILFILATNFLLYQNFHAPTFFVLSDL